MKNDIILKASTFTLSKVLRVGFYSFGQCHSIDKYFQFTTLINCMLDDPRFEPCILTDGTGIADDDLYKMYSNALEIVDIVDCLRDPKSRVDAIFVIDPYSRPKIPYQEIVDLGVKIIYKEYGAAGIEAGTGYLLNRSSYRYADLIITESEFTKQEILKKYPDKEVVVGSPAFDYIFNMYRPDDRFKEGMFHILWTPHHSVMSKESFDLIE